MGVADHGLRGAHQRRRIGVALCGVAIAVRHQVGGGEQRQLLETPVSAKGVEVEGEPLVGLVLEQRAQRQLEPGRVQVSLPRQVGRDREAVVVRGDQRLGLTLGDALHPRDQVAQVLVDNRRPQRSQERRRVVEDVAHPVHGVAE